jgi:hypothetical protein
MTRKDYEVLADAFHRALLSAGYSEEFRAGVSCAFDQVSRALAADNPRFNLEQFAEACGTSHERGQK